MPRSPVVTTDSYWFTSTSDPPIRCRVVWERDGYIRLCTVGAFPDRGATAADALAFLERYADIVTDDLADSFVLASTTIRHRVTLRGTRTSLHLRLVFTPRLVRYPNDRVLPSNLHDPAPAA